MGTNEPVTQGEMLRRIGQIEDTAHAKYKACDDAFKQVYERLSKGAETFVLLEQQMTSSSLLADYRFGQLSNCIERIETNHQAQMKRLEQSNEEKWKELRALGYSVVVLLVGHIVVMMFT